MATLAPAGAAAGSGAAAMEEGQAAPAARVRPRRVPLHVYADLGVLPPALREDDEARGSTRRPLSDPGALRNACARGPEFGTRAALDADVRGAQVEEFARSQRALQEPALQAADTDEDMLDELEPDELAALAEPGTLATHDSNKSAVHRSPSQVLATLQQQIDEKSRRVLDSYKRYAGHEDKVRL